MRLPRLELSLFWRTFLTLVALLVVGVFAWVQALRALEQQARVGLAGQQIATLVSVTREAIVHADRHRLPALIEGLRTREAVTVTLRRPGDEVRPFDHDRFAREVADQVRADLGAQTLVAGEVNGVPGLWVGFDAEAQPWWLRADPRRIRPSTGLAWIGWTALALALTIAGSALIARRINAPLRDLQFATSRANEGEYDSRLDETTLASEIREVNRGFNRMARELAKVEEDRAVMLAGISHDLRTPLARLRLEAEMSVGDDEARRAMAADIDQLDSIIGKFMDYARPGDTRLAPVALGEVVDKEAAAYRDPSQVRIANRLSPDLRVMGDAVELGRVFSNLFENARRYGRSIDTGIASVHVSANRAGDWVICSVRDRGAGVASEKLAHLTAPFFRGDAARTAATGAGLGLSIVEKAMHRMGGEIELVNAGDGGLMVHLRLRHAR